MRSAKKLAINVTWPGIEIKSSLRFWLIGAGLQNSVFAFARQTWSHVLRASGAMPRPMAMMFFVVPRADLITSLARSGIWVLCTLQLLVRMVGVLARYVAAFAGERTRA